MADKTSEIQENYVKNLKAVVYAETMEGVYKDVPDLFKFSLKFFKDVLESGRFRGTKMLEVGSGVMVHNVASASAYFPNILMSDYVQDNCDELKRWLRGESPVQQLLDIPAILEGYREDDLERGKQAVESRIRKAVKQVVRCDVLRDPTIFLEQPLPEVAPPYDLVLSSLCLESAVPDLPGLVLALRRIGRLMRPGGGLLLAGFLRGRRWKCGDTDFHHLEVSEADVQGALKEAGFVNVDMKVHDKFDFWYEHESYYCLAAEKGTN